MAYPKMDMAYPKSGYGLSKPAQENSGIFYSWSLRQPIPIRRIEFQYAVMDDPNITIEEYIQLMADKARGCDKTFNWETAMYGEVYCKDLDSFIDFETNFPAIVYNDTSTSNQICFIRNTM
ncbi:hypothetical protein Tco_0914318 [Tanacetum coccineum]